MIDDAENIRRYDRAMIVADKQAENDALWFMPEYATEDYIQKQLRYLHAILEDDPMMMIIMYED